MSEGESKRDEGSTDAEEASSGFRVIDRRRFAPDGSEREPATATREGQVEKGPAAAEPPPQTTKPAGEASGSGDFVMSDAASGSAESLAEPTLSTLLLSLSTQALMHLGEIPDVTTGQSTRDLPAARSIIDLIAVLENKTRGNLDAAESALLDRILYDLRMRFVEIARS
jgi:Domain of unknown function (DUF1844)